MDFFWLATVPLLGQVGSRLRVSDRVTGEEFALGVGPGPQLVGRLRFLKLMGSPPEESGVLFSVGSHLTLRCVMISDLCSSVCA
jgi:hypothetical protein